MKTVSVIGLGYVGLPTAALIARAGYRVHGVDVDESLIAELARGECRLDEADVNQVVTKALSSGTLTASTTPAPADIHIICVPTPVDAQGRADLRMVSAATKAMAPHVRKGDLIVLESTSPIGTTREVIGGTLKDAGLDPEIDVDICYCPERVFPGNTLNEILENDRIIGGLTSIAATRAQAFYRSFCNGTPVLSTASTAEFSKLMENTFRDVNIALANVFARIAEGTDVDVRQVIQLANMHPRVNVHLPGAGVGGHCIPVDPMFLIEAFPEDTALLSLAREINTTQVERMLKRAEAAGLKPGSKVAILGAAYRGDIDDARNTPTEDLIAALAKGGYQWQTHDPHVTRFAPHGGEAPNLTMDLGEALSDAAAVFVVTGHSDYKALRAESFGALAAPAIVFDGPGILDPNAFSDDRVRYMRVGQAAS